MNENIPPPANDEDDIYTEMQRLSRDTQRVRSAHFIAAQRKNRNAKIIGVLVIVLNILIGSGLIEATVNSQGVATTIIKALAFLAAALAGVQTFFNFQKEVECHTHAGSIYASINHRLGIIMAEYQERPANRDALFTDFRALNAEYLKANDDSVGCIPSDNDYEKARAGIERRSGSSNS